MGCASSVEVQDTLQERMEPVVSTKTSIKTKQRTEPVASTKTSIKTKERTQPVVRSFATGTSPSESAKDTSPSESANGASLSEPTSETSNVPSIVVDDFHVGYVLGKKLGRGAFAQVRIATRAKNISKTKGPNRAVKILDLRDTDQPQKTDSKLRDVAQTEADIWLIATQHKHIVQLHEVFFDESCCYYVMEECSSGLFQHLEKTATLDERFVGGVLSQMLLGVSHVHSVGVVHRDLKPDNFLVGGDDGLTVKLSDFGLSATLHENGKLKGVYGTAPFMCPEMLKNRNYDYKADVWSMAVLAYALLLGSFPYTPKAKTSKGMKQAILEGEPPKFMPAAPCADQIRSTSAVEFLKTLLVRKPEARPSAREALELPYMVASIKNQHMLEDSLPSLRPMLYSAKKDGAFEMRDLTKESDLDGVLNRLQLEKQGKPLPEMQLREEGILTKAPDSPNFNKHTIGGSDSSRIWSNASSLASGWNIAPSLATTASGKSWSNAPSLVSTSSKNSVGTKID